MPRHAVRTFTIGAIVALTAVGFAVPAAASGEPEETSTTGPLIDTPLIDGPLVDAAVLDGVENILFFGNYKDEA